MAETKWKLEQAILTLREAVQITGVSPERQAQWRARGIIPKKVGAHGRVSLEEVIRFLALAKLSRIRSLRLIRHLGPAIDYALLDLACGAMPWRFIGPTDEAAKFSHWAADRTPASRWLRSSLNITADVHRFTVISGGEVAHADSWADVEKVPGQTHVSFDGRAIAKKITAAMNQNPFVVTMAG